MQMGEYILTVPEQTECLQPGLHLHSNPAPQGLGEVPTEVPDIVDGSPKVILADEAVFFLDLEDRPENMTIMRLGGRFRDASRDRANSGF
jgi:hypothetical protein